MRMATFSLPLNKVRSDTSPHSFIKKQFKFLLDAMISGILVSSHKFRQVLIISVSINKSGGVCLRYTLPWDVAIFKTIDHGVCTRVVILLRGSLSVFVAH